MDCVAVCVCCSANCSSSLMWKDQCVCKNSAVEVRCTHLLPPQAAVPSPVQGTGPPSCPAHVRYAVSLSESVECVRWESLNRLKWRMDDHIWSCCELSGGGRSSLSIGDVLSNLIHTLCEGIHAVRVPSGTPWSGWLFV